MLTWISQRAGLISPGLCVAAACWSASVGAQDKVLAAETVPVPYVSAEIPISDKSYPWASASRALEPVPIGADGYVEAEYFVSGVARVIDRPTEAQLVELARGSYVTRILVRRPADPDRFSGRVVIEPMNPSMRYDLPLMWGQLHKGIVRDGDIWVGVTAKPVAIATLKEFDPIRYAALGFPNPLPLEATCGADRLAPPAGGLPADTTPATENGLIWDVLSQVAALIRDPSASAPLGRLKVDRVYLAGDSQSGAFVLTYANTMHSLALGADGKPLYDGYLAAVASGPSTPMHQCAERVRADDPRRRLRGVGAPVTIVLSQSEIENGWTVDRPDSDAARNLLRTYEITGSSHVNSGGPAGSPSVADGARTSGAEFDNTNACLQQFAPPNDVPFGAILTAALNNMDRWTLGGKAPPRGAPIARSVSSDGTVTVQLDAFGNALGGVRSPQVNVPAARYHARMTGPGLCELVGWRERFDAPRLRQIYASKADYVAKVAQSARSLVAEGWLEKADGDAIVSEAQARDW